MIETGDLYPSFGSVFSPDDLAAMWTLEGYNVIIAQSIANIGIGLFKLVTLNDAISILYGLLVLVQPPYEV